jgi:protein O-mannosyl-transferase
MKTTESPKKFDWRTYGIAPAILAAVTAIVYYPSVNYAFQFDDVANIKKFFAARSLSFSNWVFNGPRWISFWLNTINYKLGKHNPFYYRSFNIFFHITTGVLLFFVTFTALSRLKKDNYFGQRALPISFMTALLFLLHPVQTQTVSYVIQGQLEGLAGMFTMFILLLFLHWTTIQNTTLKILVGLLIFATAFLACGSKEIIVVSPALLLLVDWFFIAQGDWKKIWSRAPFYFLYIGTIGYYFMYKTGQAGALIKQTIVKNSMLANNIGNVITNTPGQMITRFTYFMSQFKVILHYLWIFVWPFGISVDYDWKLAPTFFCYEVIAPLMLLIVIGSAIAMLLYRDKTNVIAFGALWFFIGIAPRSTFIPSTELLADYKTYFSSYGWLFLLAIGLIYFFEWFAKKVEEFNLPTVAQSPYLAIAFCTLFLGWSTYERNKVWRSPQEFWYNIVQNAPLKARAYNNYAVSLAEDKHWEKAIPYLRKAIKMDAHYPDPWNNIAVCYNALNKVDIAIDQLHQAIKINPSYPEFYNNLASFLLLKKDYPQVCHMAKQAIHLRSYYGKAHFNWGRALYEMGKKEEGWEKIKYACRTGDYDTLEGFDVYGKMSLELSKFEDAIFGFQNVTALNPRDKDARFNLGNALFCNKQYKEAKLVYARMVQDDPTEYRCWFNLGETYAELNQRKDALRCFDKSTPLGKQIPQIGARIAEYKKGIDAQKPLIA